MITAKQALTGSIAGKQKLQGAVIKDEPVYYEGEYEVIPSIEEQVLETNRKYMKDDVTVKEIPYAEVANLANGITVTIG